MNATQVRSNPFAPRRYGWLEKVTDRVYLFRNITNSTFVVGDRSVAVIDTQVNFPTAGALLKAVRTVTDKPIEFVINTHYHWDHTNGNRLFKEAGAAVVSSALTKDFMVRRAPRQKEFLSGRGFELGEDPFLPEITFEKTHRIDLGGTPLALFHAGTAETDDATAVFVENEKVVLAGDTVMTGSFPIFGQPVWDEGLQGDGAWVRTIQNLMSLGPDHVVPGHGPLAHEAEIALLLKIESYFTEEVKRLVDRGFGLDRILADLEPRLPDWITRIPVVWGTPRYAILRVWRGLTKKSTDEEQGWQQFKPSAIPAPVGKGDSALFLKWQSKEKRALSPNDSWEDFCRMAHEAGEGGDPGLRLAILKKASQVFSVLPDAHSAYAEALVDASRAEASVLEKGDFFQAARAAWEKALSLKPDHMPTLLGKGRYLVMMAYRGGDDPRGGMTYLGKALDLRPSARFEAEAHFYLGMGRRRLGDEPGAKTCFGRALAADPSFAPAILAGQP